MCVENICMAASWTRLCLFVRYYYLLNISGFFSGYVLTEATRDWWWSVVGVAG